MQTGEVIPIDLHGLDRVLIDTTPDGAMAIVLGVRYVFEPMAFLAWLCRTYWWVLLVLACAIALWGLWLALRAQRRGIRVGVPHCRRCRYERTDRGTHPCPECGSTRPPRVLQSRRAWTRHVLWLPLAALLPLTAVATLGITGWPHRWHSFPIPRGLWYDIGKDRSGAYLPIRYEAFERDLMEVYTVDPATARARRVWGGYGHPAWWSPTSGSWHFVDAHGRAGLLQYGSGNGRQGPGKIIEWIDLASGTRAGWTPTYHRWRGTTPFLSPDRSALFQVLPINGKVIAQFSNPMSGKLITEIEIITRDPANATQGNAFSSPDLSKADLRPIGWRGGYAVFECPSFQAQAQWISNASPRPQSYVHYAPRDRPVSEQASSTSASATEIGLSPKSLSGPVSSGDRLFAEPATQLNTIEWWDTATNQPLGRLVPEEGTSLREPLATDPSGRYLAMEHSQTEVDGVSRSTMSTTSLAVRDTESASWARSAEITRDGYLRMIALGQNSRWALAVVRSNSVPQSDYDLRLIRWPPLEP